MKRKGLLTVTLTLLLCLTFALASFALPNTKQLVLDQLNNLTLNVDPGFYEKAESTGYLEIKKFDGTVKEQVGDLKGLKIDLTAQVDTPANAMKATFSTNISGQAYQADIYLADDKVILTKSFLQAIKDIAVKFGVEDLDQLDALPTYLYLQDNQLKDIWQQMAIYQKQQYPEEFKELLVFAVEAMPAKCFTVTNGKAVIKLNQKDFEETVYNLAKKVKAEPERFADIIVGLNAYSSTAAIEPEELKAELLAGVQEMPLPTKKQLAEMGKYVDVKFVMESSLVPGGKKSFDFTVDIKEPQEIVTGKVVLKFDYTGKDTTMIGTSLLAADVDVKVGPKVNFELKSNADYQGPKGKSDLTLKVKAQDNITKELYCDINLYGTTNDLVKPELVIEVPQLTEENSLDLATLMPEVPQYVDVLINGEYLEADVWPYIKDGRTMVPVRAVAEALDCTVEWVEPNEVRISSGDNVIQMYIGQTNYQVNGVEKQLDVTPFIEDGRTMVPVRFIAEALGATVELSDYTVIITK